MSAIMPSHEPPAAPRAGKLTESELDRALKQQRTYTTLSRLRDAQAEAERLRTLNSAMAEHIETLQAECDYLAYDQRTAVGLFTALGMVAGFLAGVFYVDMP